MTEASTAVFDAVSRLMPAAAVLSVTERLAGAERAHEAALDAIALEAARLRALVAAARAALARHRRTQGVSA